MLCEVMRLTQMSSDFFVHSFTNENPLCETKSIKIMRWNNAWKMSDPFRSSTYTSLSWKNGVVASFRKRTKERKNVSEKSKLVEYQDQEQRSVFLTRRPQLCHRKCCKFYCVIELNYQSVMRFCRNDFYFIFILILNCIEINNESKKGNHHIFGVLYSWHFYRETKFMSFPQGNTERRKVRERKRERESLLSLTQ